MSIIHAYRLAKHLPSPLRMAARLLSNRYFEHHGYPLTGALAGCRMLGSVNGDYLNADYERGMTGTIERLVMPADICADVGAHFGYFTLLMAKRTGPRGRVVAFEAYPPNTQQLRANVRVNGYQDWVQVENIAVCDRSSAQVALFPGRERSSAEWNIVGHDTGGNSTVPELEVAATSLDAYFAIGSQVDVVKIDVEGAEADVIRGMRRLLNECRPSVLVEFHDELGWKSKDELLTAGYTLFDIRSDRPIPIAVGETRRVYHCLAMPQERAYEILQ